MRSLILSLAVTVVFLEVSGLIWSAKDGQPSETYRRLSQPPDRRIENPPSNGYFMMIGFTAAATADPVRTGLEMWREAEADSAQRLFNYDKPGRTELRSMIDAAEAFPAWIAPNPLTEFQKPEALLRLSMGRYRTLMTRYERFLEMPFEDWGFGQGGVPRFDEFLVIHRLYVAAGFQESPELGWSRFQRDLRAWRLVLAESRTLPVKIAALIMLDDNLAFLAKVSAAGEPMLSTDSLLSLTRPFTKEDYSLRWPIQNQFVLGTSQSRAVGLELITGLDEAARNEEWLARKARLAPDAFRRVQHPPLVTLFETAVETQRVWDTYAMYYDLTIMASETVHSPLPRLRDVARSSRRTIVEAVLSPLEFEPDWDMFSVRLMETDARLRLAALQILLCRPSPSTTIPSRLAEFGPRYYDPFTGLPMLWSDQQARVYSVGRDRLDDGGDPHFDLAVPVTPHPSAQGKVVRRHRQTGRSACYQPNAYDSMPRVT